VQDETWITSRDMLHELPASCPLEELTSRVDDLSESCCPAGDDGGMECGMDTAETTDDACSWECGSRFTEFLENCHGLLEQLGAAHLA
jgi:hypothetical protein